MPELRSEAHVHSRHLQFKQGVVAVDTWVGLIQISMIVKISHGEFLGAWLHGCMGLQVPCLPPIICKNASEWAIKQRSSLKVLEMGILDH